LSTAVFMAEDSFNRFLENNQCAPERLLPNHFSLDERHLQKSLGNAPCAR
jgi:hypothetical protein